MRNSKKIKVLEEKLKKTQSAVENTAIEANALECRCRGHDMVFDYVQLDSKGEEHIVSKCNRCKVPVRKKATAAQIKAAKILKLETRPYQDRYIGYHYA